MSNKTKLILKLLEILKLIHPTYTGSVFKLVAINLIENRNIALTKLATDFCCRSIEYLLTVDTSVVSNQLNRNDLLQVVEKLTSTTSQSKRYVKLISLLNKLGNLYFDVSPCEFEYGRSINAASIRSVQLNKVWLISQVKNECENYGGDGKKCAKLLCKLETDEIDSIFHCLNFNKNILQHCFSIGTQLTLQNYSKSDETLPCDNLMPIYFCARKSLLNTLENICNAFETDVDILNLQEYTSCLLSSVINYFNSIVDLNVELEQLSRVLPKEYWLILCKFSLICLEVVKKIILNVDSLPIKNWPSLLFKSLRCSSLILKYDAITNLLNFANICNIIDVIKIILEYYSHTPLKMEQTKFNETEKDITDYDIKYREFSAIIYWLEYFPKDLLPDFLYNALKLLIINLGRRKSLSFCCRIPATVWPISLNPDVPLSIPADLLHEIDIIKEIIFRTSLLGWNGRLQFEETWVCLLSTLDITPDVNSLDEETLSIIMQSNSMVVDGITWLLLTTLSKNFGDTRNLQYFHVPRLDNNKIYLLSKWKKLEELNNLIEWKLKENFDNFSYSRIDKRENLERVNNYGSYDFGQLTVRYLRTQITAAEDRSENEDKVLCTRRENQLDNIGIDLRSCVQFMLDLFSQWHLPSTDSTLTLQLSIVKSLVNLSDIFNERNYFKTMLNTLMEFSKIQYNQDEILLQYIIVGICKAAAVLNNFDGEVGEKIIKLLDYSFTSNFMSLRLSAIHGIFYILQNFQHFPANFIKDSELHTVQYIQEFKKKIFNMTMNYLKKHFLENFCVNEEIQLIIPLIIYIMEYFPDEIKEFTQNIINNLSFLAKNAKNKNIYQIVMQALERLVLISRPDLCDQITRIALERFSQSNPTITMPALQLLISCIYRDETNNSTTDVEVKTMESLEKTSAFFDRIKKGYPLEVEVVCEILPYILSDTFNSSDILTKVIGEFLSPNQPHKQHMAEIVFQIFNQACTEQQLPLLQDWVVYSINNFITNLPVVMATWSLCCFFISASTNQWLRAIFPHVQNRIKQCDYDDRKILCIAALDFFKQLTKEQQESFIKSFKDFSAQKGPFSDILACLL